GTRLNCYGGILFASAILTFHLIYSSCMACPTTYHIGDMQPINNKKSLGIKYLSLEILSLLFTCFLVNK
ncbi:hypothetical protein, partial [Clostridium perfringens]|uniref:hypothetical protein n=1 Tax=Clostridium perfringens TaxID=1502 RepID=UPI003F42C047